MESQQIIVRGAREHNLRNVNLELPRNKLIVVTRLSGSGISFFLRRRRFSAAQV